MESTLDTPLPEDTPAPMPGGTGSRIATAARRPLRRKAVIVGSARASEALGEKFFRTWPVGHGPGLAVLDAHRMDGQLIPYLRTEAPDEVYFDLGANLDERIVTRVGAALLMGGACVRLVLPQAARPRVQVAAAARGRHTVISLHVATRSNLFRRMIVRLLGLLGAVRERVRLERLEVEEKFLRDELHRLLRTVPAIIQQRDAL